MKYYKSLFSLSVIILILVFFASIGGLFSDSLYQDNERFTVIWKSNDLVTLIIAIPLLCAILFRSIKHMTSRLLMSWIGLIWFIFYNYAFYVFGAKFNDFYLIYLFIFTLSIPVLIYGMIELIQHHLVVNQKAKYPYFLIGGYLIFIAVGLSFVYIMQSFNYIIKDEIPSIVTLGDHITSVVFSLDFSMVILFFVMAAIYLFKKNPMGIALTWILNVKSMIYMVVLSYSSYQLKSQEIGLWLIIFVFSLLVLVLSYKHIDTKLIER